MGPLNRLLKYLARPAQLFPRGQCGIRGSDTVTESLFSIKRLDDFVPALHPLRAILAMVNDALGQLE